MQNKLKTATNHLILELFKVEGHTVEGIEKEVVSILGLKIKDDKEKTAYLQGKLNEVTSNITDTDSISHYIISFRRHFKFIISDNGYKNLRNEFEEIDMNQIVDITFDSIKELVRVLINNEINTQMSKVMNAVKGLRQDLFQNDYCTGQAAYRETVRMLFLKMVEDKAIKEGNLEKRFYDFDRNSFLVMFDFHKTLPGKENDTETDYLNLRFKQDVLDLNGEAEYKIYKDLFKASEDLISSPQMIYKFVQKLEGVDFVDLMDYGKDILGIVYEQFIGEVQNSQAGQIFTPTDVVEFMCDIAEFTMDDICLDFCSGSGRFMTSAMRRMISDTRNHIEDEDERDKKIEQIKHHQVYGADIGADPTLNTKRNMALAGDGSSHVANMNSLFIKAETQEDGSVTGTFINGKGVNKVELVGKDEEEFQIKDCSCILTNPPFGDLTLNDAYDQEWIDTMREIFNQACKSELKRWKPQFENLIMEAGITDNDDLKDAFDELLDRAPIDRNREVEKAVEKINNSIELNDVDTIKKQVDVIFTKGARNVSTKYKVKKGAKVLDGRKDFKGCLMFLYKAYQLLKVGGKCLIVVDDGILNTDTYAFARDFIRNKFIIKGVFSLSDKAFYAHSDKIIKTSILYLEKKAELMDADGDLFTEKQTDPTFYAHIEKTGQNSKRGKYESHFEEVKNGYFKFINRLNQNKNNNKGIFDSLTFEFEEVSINNEDMFENALQEYENTLDEVAALDECFMKGGV